jgi:hypothetical protein
VEPASQERAVMRLIKRAKLFVFLRQQRHEIFDEEFQEELGAIYLEMASLAGPRSRRRGSPWPPSCRPTPASQTTRSWRRP